MWVYNKSIVKMDELRMIVVNFRKVDYRDEPFIMAQQALKFSMLKILRLSIGLLLFMEKNRLILMKRI